MVDVDYIKIYIHKSIESEKIEISTQGFFKKSLKIKGIKTIII